MSAFSTISSTAAALFSSSWMRSRNASGSYLKRPARGRTLMTPCRYPSKHLLVSQSGGRSAGRRPCREYWEGLIQVIEATELRDRIGPEMTIHWYRPEG